MAIIHANVASGPVLSSPKISGSTNISSGNQRSGISAMSVSAKSASATPASATPASAKSASVQGTLPSLQDVKQAIKMANSVSNQSVTFGYEEKLGELIVQVSDSNTGQLIHQFPSKSFIQFQLGMREMGGLVLDKTA